MTAPLTREEILAKEPGPELDKLIAEHVMGWSIYRYDKDVPERCYYMLVDKSFDPVVDGGYWNAGERKTEEEAWKDNRPFSTDISAAWEVVTHLMNDRKDVIVQCVSFEVNRLFDCAIYEHEEEVAVTSMLGSAPEAICKAALLARLNL